MQSSHTDFEVCVVAYASDAYAPIWIETAAQLASPLAVADNEPGFPSLLAIKQSGDVHPKMIRTIGLANNPGFGSACNALAATSSATWLLFLNPDARIESWPYALQPPRSGTIYGAIQARPNGVPIHSAGRSWTVRDEMGVAWLRRQPTLPQGSGYVSGGAMLIERKLFIELGGFDEKFFLFYEDIDLCLRACAAGTRVEADPAFTIVHELGHATRKNWSNALRFSFSSGDYFHRKHKHSVVGYRLFVTIDSTIRFVFHTTNRDTARARAYARLACCAIRALISKNPP